MTKNLNEYIKSKATDTGRQNIFTVSGNTITPVSYTSYYSPTENANIKSIQITNDGNGNIQFNQSSGIYGALSDSVMSQPKGLNPVTAKDLLVESDDATTSSNLTAYIKGDNTSAIVPNRIIANKNGKLETISSDNSFSEKDVDFTLSDSLQMDSIINGDSRGYKRSLREFINNIDPLEIIHQQNTAIKNKAFSKNSSIDNAEESGVITPEKLRYFRPSLGMSLLDDPSSAAELINASKGADFVKDAAQSARLITGIYGYMLGTTTGFGSNTDKRIAQSSDMTSFSRTFWDLNLGGAGGSVAEIARRFIPDFKRNNIINPLRNTMPEWLPDKYHYGDPFTALQEGEARLPGKGYESLNKLHPDMYADDGYGSFDRFKILADVAPFSPEFKIWREIAKKTVTDPNLIAEMDAITQRVNQQGKKHDFYDYKVVGRGLNYQNVIVSEVLSNGKFRSGDTVYKLAGARVKSNADENMSQVLGRYIHPGDEITIATDQDEYAGTNKDSEHSISVAVFNQYGQNLAQEMLQNGDASRRKGDTSTPATLINYSPFQKAIGYVSEIIAHADVPWLSDQFLRVRSPLESYSAEQVYGTPYQSWEHPIDTFLMPAIERTIHEKAWIPSFALKWLSETEGIDPYTKKAINAAFLLINRGAFIGAALTNLYRTPGSEGAGKTIMRNARLGANLGYLGYFISGGTSYFKEMSLGALYGYEIAKFFEQKSPAKYAIVGALASAVYRKILGDDYDWIPDRTKRKWDTEEYFDRLTYIKYMGLYHEAAKRAKDEEDVDIETFLEQQEKRESFRQTALQRMKSIKEQLKESGQTPERDRLIKLVNSKINALDKEPTIVKGGEWTHSALIYKQTAENTMTALNTNSSWSQIVTALPTNDREYFMEFVKERNPKKRQEILKLVSPSLRKALNIAWGKTKTDPDIDKENEDFFSTHNLPTEDWIAWRPDIDLKDVEVKTIANEGENLSDFGFYESQLRNPNVINAPSVNYSNNNSVDISNKLKRVLQGQGLENVDISITSGAVGSGHQIITDIKLFTGIDDLQNMTNESLKQGIM